MGSHNRRSALDQGGAHALQAGQEREPFTRYGARQRVVLEPPACRACRAVKQAAGDGRRVGRCSLESLALPLAVKFDHCFLPNVHMSHPFPSFQNSNPFPTVQISHLLTAARGTHMSMAIQHGCPGLQYGKAVRGCSWPTWVCRNYLSARYSEGPSHSDTSVVGTVALGKHRDASNGDVWVQAQQAELVTTLRRTHRLDSLVIALHAGGRVPPMEFPSR
jgi:hypothetical protein